MDQTTQNTPNIYRGTVNVGSKLDQEVIVGWLKADPTGHPDFPVYSKNTAEYLACELQMIGFNDQIYGDTILEILQKTELAGKRFCFLNQIGYWSSQIHHEFNYFINNTYSDQAIVGIDLYGRLCGLALVNIDWWISAGRPDPETDEFYVAAIAQGVRRWPDSHSKDYLFQEIRVSNLNPATAHEYDRVMDRMNRLILQMDIFFCANTEDFALDAVNDGIPTDTIITVAGGLSAVLMAYSNNMLPGATIHIVDTSPLAIAMSREIFQNWDGTNYADFIHKLIDADIDVSARLRGVRLLPAIDEALKKIPGFPEWFNNTFKTYNIHYTELNLMEYEPVKKLLMMVSGIDDMHDPDKTLIVKSARLKQRRVDINFSNVYHYAPSAFYIDYNTRFEMSNKLARLVARISAASTTVLHLNGGNIINYTKLLEMFPWRK